MKNLWKARLLHGGYATLLTILVIVIIVAFNLLADAADQRFLLRLDMTENSLSTLTEESVAAAEKIDQDAVIYLVFRNGSNSELRTILESLTQRYRALNAHIRIETVDPVSQPGLVNKLKEDSETISEGSVIVTNADLSRKKTIQSSDLYTYTYDESTGSYTVSSFDGEAALTSALIYVTSLDAPRVLFLTGHSELSKEYCSTFVSQLERENFEVRSFELGGTEALEPDDTVILITPSLDLTDAEQTQLRDFINAGGRMLYVNDPSIEPSTLPKFQALLAETGLEFKSGVVVEDAASSGNYLSGQLYLIPNTDTASEITAPLSGNRLILPGACAVGAESNDNYTVQTLLSSSSLSYLKPADYEGDLFTPLDTDERGPFVLAASSMLENDEGKGARIVAVGNLYVVADSDYMYSSANLDFAVNAVKWLANRQTGIQVRSKALSANVLAIPDARTLWLLAMLVVALIPGAMLIAGTAMYIRRHRL